MSTETPMKHNPYERWEDEYTRIDYPSNLSLELLTRLEEGVEVTIEHPTEIVLLSQISCTSTAPLRMGERAWLQGNAHCLTLRYYDKVYRKAIVRKYARLAWFTIAFVFFIVAKVLIDRF